MIELQKLEIKTNKKQFSYPLNDGVIALRGMAEYGKSSLISLLYVLLGSESTLSGKNSFEIYKNTNTFNLGEGDSFSLYFNSDIGIQNHTIEIKKDKLGENQLLYFINNKQVANIKHFKNNYNNLSETFELNNFQNNNISKFTRYNIDSYFRAFQDTNKIFAPSLKTQLINKKIHSMLLGNSSELLLLMAEREKKYFEESKMKRLSNKDKVLRDELKDINVEIENHTANNNLTKSDSDIILKMRNNSQKRIELSISLSTLQNKEKASTYVKYLKMVENINFNNNELEKITKEYITKQLIKTSRLIKSSSEIKKEIQDLEDSYLKLDDKLKIREKTGNEQKRIQYLLIRKDVIEEYLQKNEYNPKNHDILKKEISNLTEKINDISNKLEFIESANKILNKWKNNNNGKYINVSSDFILKRDILNESTTTILTDKIISFITAINNLKENILQFDLMPSIISIDKMVTDMNKDDFKNFQEIADIFSEDLGKISKVNKICIIVQDKHEQLNGDWIRVIDMEKDNPFQKISKTNKI